jgi:hypothetical protein
MHQGLAGEDAPREIADFRRLVELEDLPTEVAEKSQRTDQIELQAEELRKLDDCADMLERDREELADPRIPEVEPGRHQVQHEAGPEQRPRIMRHLIQGRGQP